MLGAGAHNIDCPWEVLCADSSHNPNRTVFLTALLVTISNVRTSCVHVRCVIPLFDPSADSWSPGNHRCCRPDNSLASETSLPALLQVCACLLGRNRCDGHDGMRQADTRQRRCCRAQLSLLLPPPAPSSCSLLLLLLLPLERGTLAFFKLVQRWQLTQR